MRPGGLSVSSSLIFAVRPPRALRAGLPRVLGATGVTGATGVGIGVEVAGDVKSWLVTIWLRTDCRAACHSGPWGVGVDVVGRRVKRELGGGWKVGWGGEVDRGAS